jgi:hypothetical protein
VSRPTRTVAECEHLVELWEAGKRDQVRAVIGEPHPDFLRDFKAQASSSTPVPKRKSKQAAKASRERASAPI